jgi:hypothetical protein
VTRDYKRGGPQDGIAPASGDKGIIKARAAEVCARKVEPAQIRFRKIEATPVAIAQVRCRVEASGDNHMIKPIAGRL